MADDLSGFFKKKKKGGKKKKTTASNVAKAMADAEVGDEPRVPPPATRLRREPGSLPAPLTQGCESARTA